jgi:hypothetical protein
MSTNKLLVNMNLHDIIFQFISIIVNFNMKKKIIVG